MYVPGNPMTQTKANPQACCNTCAATPLCSYWQYVPDITIDGKRGKGACFLLHDKIDYTCGEMTAQFSTETKPVHLQVRVGGECNPSAKVLNDPHLVGAHGTDFDFNGRPDKAFCLLTDRNLHVNMLLRGYYSDNTENAALVVDGKAVHTWIKELGIIWTADGVDHKLRLAARGGKQQERGDGFMKAIEIDGMMIPRMQLGDVVTSAGGLAIEFRAHEMEGPFAVDYYHLPSSRRASPGHATPPIVAPPLVAPPLRSARLPSARHASPPYAFCGSPPLFATPRPLSRLPFHRPLSRLLSPCLSSHSRAHIRRTSSPLAALPLPSSYLISRRRASSVECRSLQNLLYPFQSTYLPRCNRLYPLPCRCLASRISAVLQGSSYLGAESSLSPRSSRPSPQPPFLFLSPPSPLAFHRAMDPFKGGSKGATAVAAAAGRRGSLRQRKVAADVVAVMLDEGTRKRAAAARLEALESDYTGVDAAVDEDDHVFNAEEELVQEGFAPAKRVSRPGKRRTRQSAAAVVSRASKRTPKTFAELLEE
ncbi:unnamed protein product, partial [Closterium sp. Naga37s-1]